MVTRLDNWMWVTKIKFVYTKLAWFITANNWHYWIRVGQRCPSSGLHLFCFCYEGSLLQVLENVYGLPLHKKLQGNPAVSIYICMEAPNIFPLIHHNTRTMSSSEEKLETIVIAGEKDNVSDHTLDDDSKPTFRNGEPIITTGRDVSRFVVDIRDDEAPALTFRSIFLGTVFAGMGAALSQVDFWILSVPSQWDWPFLVDILVQASADGSLYSLLVAPDLYCW